MTGGIALKLWGIRTDNLNLAFSQHVDLWPDIMKFQSNGEDAVSDSIFSIPYLQRWSW